MPTVLLSAPFADPVPDLRAGIEAAGFAVVGHDLGAIPPADFSGVAVAVVAVRNSASAAVAQTAHWRAELGDEFVPVLWLLRPADAGLAPVGLKAGADACLVEPVEPAHLAAQLKAMAADARGDRPHRGRAAEARLLGDQLRQAFARHDADRDLARLVHRAALPADLPVVGTLRATVCHRPHGRAGTAFYDARRVGSALAFLVGDVPGRGGSVGSLLGLLALRAAFPPGETDPDPAATLSRVNRELLALGLDDPPLVALLAGVADGPRVTVARAGIPAPVWVPADGEAEAWSAPGPFLGTVETTYPSLTRASPGDRLLVGTAGTGGADALLAAARKLRHVAGPGFVEVVAADLLPATPEGEDFTLVSVECFAREGDGV